MKKYKNQYEKMTSAPVSTLVVSLGIPTTISMLVTNIYNMADTFFVGKLGTSASGAIGIVFGFMSILQAFGFMLGQGAGSVISRMLGKKNEEMATRYASTSFFSALIVGILIQVLGFAFIEPLLKLLGSTDTILPYARNYVSFILIATPFTLSCFVMNNILRFEGKATNSMIGLLAGAMLNMIGDPILIFGFDMGITGAGLSTALSQIASFLILLYMFLSGRTKSKLSIRKVSGEKSTYFNILATGSPSMFRQGLGSLSTMLLNNCAGVYGDFAVAGMSIVSRISMFIFAVGLGMGQGFQPVCGFNYGAGKYKRVKKAYFFTLILAEIMLGAFAITGLIASPYAVRLFRNDNKVVEIGTFALQIQCVALIFHPVMVLTNMMLQSTGKKLQAVFTSLLRNGLYFIPLLFILTHFGGLRGVQITQPIADILACMTCVPFMVNFFKRLPKDDGDNY